MISPIELAFRVLSREVEIQAREAADRRRWDAISTARHAGYEGRPGGRWDRNPQTPDRTPWLIEDASRDHVSYDVAVMVGALDRGALRRPDSRGQRAVNHNMRDARIALAVQVLADRGWRPTRGAASEPASGCDHVAAAMRMLRLRPATYDGIRGIWRHVRRTRRLRHWIEARARAIAEHGEDF